MKRRPSDADDDAQLQRALELSREAARLEQMTEDELIREALRRSMQHDDNDKNKTGEVHTIASHDVGTTPGPSRGSTAVVESQPPSSKPEAPRIAPLFASPRAAKKARTDDGRHDGPTVVKVDAAPADIDWERTLLFSPAQGRIIDRLQGSLDLVYWPGWLLPHPDADRGRKVLYKWMLEELQWHRVCYTRPNGFSIRTPRYTTTFGRDDSGAPDSAYEMAPKPFPRPLQLIKDEVERLTGSRFNAVIVNFYADGTDSISYHSDDEAFLGPNPSIASLTLGSSRDFYLRRKAPAGVAVAAATTPSGSKGEGPASTRPTEKMVLHDGDLLLMRGRTQAEWEHSVPKRANAGGRINLTFRRCVNQKGTNNFLHYNRGQRGGEVNGYRWRKGGMVPGGGGI